MGVEAEVTVSSGIIFFLWGGGLDFEQRSATIAERYVIPSLFPPLRHATRERCVVWVISLFPLPTIWDYSPDHFCR